MKRKLKRRQSSMEMLLNFANFLQASAANNPKKKSIFARIYKMPQGLTNHERVIFLRAKKQGITVEEYKKKYLPDEPDPSDYTIKIDKDGPYAVKLVEE